jgi:hypothetical protein
MFRYRLTNIRCLVCIYIQGDSGAICNTLGNDNMCDSKQKCSYEHVSDFEPHTMTTVPRRCTRMSAVICHHSCELRTF